MEEAPNYLSDQLTYVDELSVRETSCNLLHLPFSKTCYYERSFFVNGRRCWNNLPPNVR